MVRLFACHNSCFTKFVFAAGKKVSRSFALGYLAPSLQTTCHMILVPVGLRVPTDTLRKRAWPKLVGLHRFYHLPRATNTGSSSTKNSVSRNSTPHKRPRPTSQVVQTVQERSSPSPVQTNIKRTKHPTTPITSNNDHDKHVYQLDRFLDGDALFANGLAPPSTTSVPNHDPRDYYNLVPQMEIDASVVVAADQAAEEAAQQKLLRRVDSGSLDESAAEVSPTKNSEDSVNVEPPPTPQAGSSSKPPSLKNKQNAPKLRSFGVSSPSSAPPKEPPKSPSAVSPTVFVECKDAVQIHRDVVRCTWHLLTGTQRSRRLQYKHKDRRKVGSLLHKKQFRLANLLNWTLFQSSYTQQQQQQILGGGGMQPLAEDVGNGDEESLLRYYQGFHDVASIFMATLSDGNQSSITTASPSKEQRNGNDDEMDSCAQVEENEWEKIHPDEILRDLQEQAMALGLDLPSRVLLQLSYSHFRDNLRSTFVQLQTALRIVLFPLLHALDPHGVHAHLVDCDMEPFFCLSWVITWFAHDVRDTELVKRLFDAFIVSHPLFPIYLSIAMLLHPVNRSMILMTDCDFAAVHHCLTMLPRNSCRVGWKKRKQVDGDDEDVGYVSDDGEPQSPVKRTRRGDSVSRQSGCDTDDDGTLSTDLDVSLISDGWGSSIPLFERQQQRRGDADDDDSKDDAHSSSMLSGSLLSASPSSVGRIGMIPDNERVPFQELINTAIKYMRRYPPRCLVPLARAYYKTDKAKTNSKDHANMSYYENGPRERMVMQPPMTDEMWNGVVNTITILQPTPPIWSITPFTKADWVLKQRARARMGLSSTSRKDRRNIAKQRAAAPKDAVGENLEEEDDGAPMPLVDYDFIRKNCGSRAVIACGFGTGEEDERKRRRRQRVVLAATSVLIVGLVAISVGYIANSYSASKNTATTKSTSNASTSLAQNGSASDTTSSTRTICIDNVGCGQLETANMFETDGNKCFDPIVLPSFSSVMATSSVDTRYGCATDSNDAVIGDSVPDAAMTAEISVQETSVSMSTFKPMTIMLGHVTLRMHRLSPDMRALWKTTLSQPLRQMRLSGFLEEGSLQETFKPLTNALGQVTLKMHRVFHEMRMQWQANLFKPLGLLRLPALLGERLRKDTYKPLITVLEDVKPRMNRLLHDLPMELETNLFQPLRQTRLPGFLEEEFVEETSLGHFYDVPTVLGYARELATGAHKEARRYLDTVGINLAFSSRSRSSEDESKAKMESSEVLESKDDTENMESYYEMEGHSVPKKSHGRELGIVRVVRSAASAMDSLKTNVAHWPERARERHRAEQAAGN
jgi:Rab-GTPase-TBC domain